MNGRFCVLRIHQAKLIEEKSGNKIFGVRLAKFLPDGWLHLPNTGPSKSLLFEIKNLEKRNEWNSLSFKNLYLPKYLKDIKEKKALNEFLLMKEMLDKGEDVYYACYCKEERLCHRSIVKQIFKQRGYSVYSLK